MQVSTNPSRPIGAGLIQQPESGREVLVRPIVGSAARTAEVVSADEAKREAFYSGLIACAADHRELYRRAAVYVDKILKGTKAGDLPLMRIVPFNLVDEQVAREEEESDLSHGWWRRAHWDYFSTECQRLGRTPSEDMPIVCQRFRVLYPHATG